MTLLIALIANGIYEHEVGRQFIETGWIVVLWVCHLMVRSKS
ncbi:MULTISPECIES: hypothetical protein [Brucella]|uniref:Uncharacterized protein n=1 Tax=Brucella lupini TaxID=255457 RepID=A0A256GH70_9HYPH|nr:MULTISPECIES: hypothetical protein [Brucella]OYR26236.1 hypothetical protein CES86_3704 [Brucella lupini]SUA60197.1 Uncharacterised protein [Brucella anthropi]SUB56223.1 Uncharacterised protein [Brucella anthropi]DAE48920.1 MAG TPA: hypothetical protein [Caudoviricetes sp.]